MYNMYIPVPDSEDLRVNLYHIVDLRVTRMYKNVHASSLQISETITIYLQFRGIARNSHVQHVHASSLHTIEMITISLQFPGIARNSHVQIVHPNSQHID